MKIFGIAILSISLVVAACVHEPMEPIIMHAFDNLPDEKAFWVKSFEIAMEAPDHKGKGYPMAYKACFADAIVAASTPELHSAVTAFLKDNDTEKSSAISVALGKPHSSMFEATVVLDAFERCELVYHMEMYETFRDVRSYRDYSMALLKYGVERDGIAWSDLPHDVIDCFVDGYWKGLPSNLRVPVDVFLEDRSRENWQAIYEVFSAGGMKDKERTTRLEGTCKAKF